MVKFMSRSIDGMEKLAKESDNVFAMTRRGYLFVSEKEEAGKAYKAAALDASRWVPFAFSKYIKKKRCNGGSDREIHRVQAH